VAYLISINHLWFFGRKIILEFSQIYTINLNLHNMMGFYVVAFSTLS